MMATSSRSHGFKPSFNLVKPQLDNFANGTSAVYIDMMYDQWKQDPNSVHSSWKAYFNNID
jgi:2-oxoglutarate dehydrogenase complex dehydrogenase (E1) component-like enzyme